MKRAEGQPVARAGHATEARTAGAVDEAVDHVARASQTVQRHPAYRLLVRLGLYCYGLVHLLLAFLTLRIAKGVPVDASNQGSLTRLASWPLGHVLIVVLGVGMAALAFWMVLEAAFGYPWLDGMKRVVRRVSCALRAVVYASLAMGALHLAQGAKIAGGNQQAQQTTRNLLTMPGGRVLVFLVGVGVAIAAGDQIQRGVRKSFIKYDLAGTIPTWAKRLGIAGWVAKGATLGVVAILFWTAALKHSAAEAGGLDMALKSLREQPFGQVLLVLMALGFACFGVYCFVWASHARHDASPDKDPR